MMYPHLPDCDRLLIYSLDDRSDFRMFMKDNGVWSYGDDMFPSVSIIRDTAHRWPNYFHQWRTKVMLLTGHDPVSFTPWSRLGVSARR